MNKVIMMGRLTRDPETRYGQGGAGTAVGSFSIAVDRRFKREGDPDADFFDCTVFGKQAEFVEKYLKKGTKVVAIGRIQTGSYTNKDGQRVYTTDVIVEELEFAESKGAQSGAGDFGGADSGRPSPADAAVDGFMNIPDGIDEELPFV